MRRSNFTRSGARHPTAAIDEHLLLCRRCCEPLNAEREYVAVMLRALWTFAPERRMETERTSGSFYVRRAATKP